MVSVLFSNNPGVLCVFVFKREMFLPKTRTKCFGVSLSEKGVYMKAKEPTASQELQKS